MCRQNSFSQKHKKFRRLWLLWRSFGFPQKKKKCRKLLKRGSQIGHGHAQEMLIATLSDLSWMSERNQNHWVVNQKRRTTEDIIKPLNLKIKNASTVSPSQYVGMKMRNGTGICVFLLRLQESLFFFCVNTSSLTLSKNSKKKKTLCAKSGIEWCFSVTRSTLVSLNCKCDGRSCRFCVILFPV